jgi:outer membrane receptor protein involved in Fe transport
VSVIIAGEMIRMAGRPHGAVGWCGPLTIALAAVLSTAPAAAQSSTPEPAQSTSQAEPPQYEETIDVVGVTPIHGIGIDRDKVPANVQTATAADLDRLPGGHVGDVLATRFGSVSVNEAQSNAFQPDIQFRGFAASPLLGLPQGIAVYQDGVRVNELFGDTVNWDVLPVRAIASVNLMPGSNPLFGLNALGGAISMQTKSGFSNRGHSAQLYAGSFGRRWLDVESGGHGSRFGYFVTGRLLGDDGWRDFSESRVRQLFASLQWRGAATTVNAAVTGGANRLVGNGPAPVQLLDEDRRAVFTHPDITRADIGLFSLSVGRVISRQLTLDGVLFYRPVRVRTVNGDDTPYGPCEDAPGFLCEDEGDGNPVIDGVGRPIALSGDPLDATSNTSSTRTDGWGGSLQATWVKPLDGRANQLIVGGSLDAGRSRYGADTEIARLTDSRGAAGTGIFDAGAAVRLRTNVRHGGLFASDYFTLTPRTTLMGSARLSHSRVRLRDQIGTALDGDHSFTRLNPAAGATFAVTPATTMFGSVSMTSRAPTPSELSCADPEDPCRLPNAFVADPPLRQVVARTFEGGVRGRIRRAVWNASAFTTANHDDILFVSSGALTNQGHFENVGDTRRLGLELGASGSTKTARWNAAYTWLRATFRTPLVLSSPHHPDAVDGEVAVTAGAGLPGVPRHTLKLGMRGAARAATFGATLMAVSGQQLRGDEPNRLAPIDGFATVGASAGYAIRRNVTIVLQVSNLLNARYATFGLLGDPEDVLGEGFDNPRFVSPGAPRAAWVGLEYLWR